MKRSDQGALHPTGVAHKLSLACWGVVAEGVARMGRREGPLDPAAGPVQRFAFELRKLRQEAGDLTYRTMAQRTAYSVATLSRAAAGEQLPSFAVVLAYVQACGADTAEWERRWRAVAEQVAGEPGDGDDAEAPYRGLARFEPVDRDVFFGRDQLVAQLAERVYAHRLVAVVGASGSGKSSLLRAGLIPTLQAEDSSDRRPAAIRILTPGPHPISTHATALTASQEAGDTVVVVDQFEELFALCDDPAERAAFLDVLGAAVEPERRLRVVIAVRADFFGRCAEHHAFAAALREATLLVGTMNPTELRQAIVKPAAAVGLIVERELTAKIIEEVCERPGGLPLMSHALLETWRRRKGRTLTLAAYQAAGGVNGALTRTAEQLYTQCPAEQAEFVRRILLRLITPGEGAQDTSRPADRAELEVQDSTGEPADAAAVLERLARARLITLDGDTVHLAHEALITAWPRLRSWVDDARDRLRLHRRLTQDARTWDELDRDPGAVYRGTRLTAVEEAFTEHREDLTAVESAFLDAGVVAREQEQHAAARTSRRLRTLVASLSTLLVLALLAGVVAWQQNRNSNRQAIQTAARRVAAVADGLRSFDPKLAMRLSVAAWHIADLPESRSALLASLARADQDVLTDPPPSSSGTIRHFLSGDAGTFVSVGSERVVMWDVARRRREVSRAGLGPDVFGVEGMSPDARTLAVITGDRQPRLLDLRTGRWWSAPSHPRMHYTAINLQPSGRSFVLYSTVGSDALVQLMDLTTHRLLLERRLEGGASGSPMGTVRVPDMKFDQVTREFRREHYPFPDAQASPDDRYLALCVPGAQVEVWDVAERRLIPTPWAPRVSPLQCLSQDVQFTPDSHKLVVIDPQGVRAWDLASGTETLSLRTAGVTQTTFSNDGTFILTCDGRQLLLWRLTDQSAPVTSYRLTNTYASQFRMDMRHFRLGYLEGLNGDQMRTLDLSGVLSPAWRAQPTTAAVLTHDGRTLATATASAGGRAFQVDLWDAVTGKHISKLPGVSCAPSPNEYHAPCSALMAFRPDGRALAHAETFTGGNGRHVHLWDITARAPDIASHNLPPLPYDVAGLSYTPDGKSLIVSGVANSGEQTEIWSPSHPARVKVIPGEYASLAVRPDGHLLIASRNIIQLPSGEVASRTLSQGDVTAAFSPDGKYLATGDVYSGRVTLWDADAEHPLAVLPGPFSPEPNTAQAVTALAFSHNGSLLAAAGVDGTIHLWDLASRQPFGPPLSTPGGLSLSLAFSLDDSTLLASDQHVPLHSYVISAQQMAEAACTRLQTGLSPADWRTYLPDVPYQKTC